MIGLITTLFVSIYHLLWNFFLNSTSWNGFRTRWCLPTGPLPLFTRIIINMSTNMITRTATYLSRPSSSRENNRPCDVISSFFLINNFSTGGDSPYRSFPHSKGNALNLGKKREEITFNFTIPSHELVVIYSGIDIKQLDKKKKGETPPFRVSVKRSKEARVVYIGWTTSARLHVIMRGN